MTKLLNESPLARRIFFTTCTVVGVGIKIWLGIGVVAWVIR
jgi:hypothetical protein